MDKPPTNNASIDTGGGTYISGSIDTGGDFVGRDKHIHYYGVPPQSAQLFLNVPPMPAHFVGREVLLEQTVDQLCTGPSTAISIDGLPGVGKTTLAIALTRHPRVLAHFNNGVLWAGLGRTPDVASIQASWAHALEVELADLIAPDQRLQRLSNAMGTRRLLLVLDDAWQLEAVQQLKCNAPHVVHLLTTRNQEIARRFAGAQQSLNIPVLPAQPSYALLKKLAPEAYASDPKAAQQLADKVGGLPLALDLLGGYLDASSRRRTQSRRQQALSTLADPAARLPLASKRLGDASNQEVTLQQTIALSLEELSAPSVVAFYALGAFAPKPARFDLSAALAVTEADEELLIALADRNLIEWNADETLALHQILADLAHSQTPPAASARHRDYYLAQVNQDQENWQRIETIYPQVSFAWQQLGKDDPASIDFVDSLTAYQDRRGLRQERLLWLADALSAAQAQQDEKAAARMLHEYGYVYYTLGEYVQALTFYNLVLPLWRQVGNKFGEADTLNNIGRVYAAQDDHLQALTFYEQALPLWKQVGNKSCEARTLSNIGNVYAALGDYLQALTFHNQALPLQQQVGNKSGEANTLSNIGRVYAAQGDYLRALTLYNQALPLQRRVGYKSGEARTLSNIGNVYAALSDHLQALTFYNQALPLQRQIGDRWAERATSYNIAMVHRAIGDLEAAEDFLLRTIELDETITHPELASDRAMLEIVHAQRSGEMMPSVNVQ